MKIKRNTLLGLPFLLMFANHLFSQADTSYSYRHDGFYYAKIKPFELMEYNGTYDCRNSPDSMIVAFKIYENGNAHFLLNLITEWITNTKIWSSCMNNNVEFFKKIFVDASSYYGYNDFQNSLKKGASFQYFGQYDQDLGGRGTINPHKGHKDDINQGYVTWALFSQKSPYSFVLHNPMLFSLNLQRGEKYVYNYEFKFDKDNLTVISSHESQQFINKYKIRFVEVKELNYSAEDYQIQLKKRQQEDEKIRLEKERQQKLEAQKRAIIENEFEKKRIAAVRLANVGDRICYSQNWVHTEKDPGIFGIGSYTQKTNYQMIVVCYVERREGNKFQIRVASIKSSNNQQYSIPDYNGVKLTEGSIHWINPMEDRSWIICE